MNAETDETADARPGPEGNGAAAGLAVPDLGSPNIVAALQGRVLRLRIDRTERRNAFTQDMYRAIKRAAVWADEQPELDARASFRATRWNGTVVTLAWGSSDTAFTPGAVGELGDADARCARAGRGGGA
jgi:hypothetical protein